MSHIAGFACIALMNSTSTLMIDLVPGQSSSVTACVRELIHELEEEVLIIFIRTIFYAVLQVPYWYQSSS